MQCTEKWRCKSPKNRGKFIPSAFQPILVEHFIDKIIRVYYHRIPKNNVQTCKIYRLRYGIFVQPYNVGNERKDRDFEWISIENNEEKCNNLDSKWLSLFKEEIERWQYQKLIIVGKSLGHFDVVEGSVNGGFVAGRPVPFPGHHFLPLVFNHIDVWNWEVFSGKFLKF